MNNSRSPQLRFTFIFAILLLSWLPKSTYAWYNASWHYRVAVNIPAGSSVNSTVKLDVDFAALLTSLGANSAFDVNSPRVVRTNDTTLSTTQEFSDSIYQGATDATSNSRGEIRFLLEDAGATTYYLYFDITANGSKTANPQTPINGNFEQSTAGTEDPAGWTASKAHTDFDAQVRPSENPPITSDGNNPSPNPTTKTTDGTPLTGAYSYLIGARTNYEPTNPNNSGGYYPAVTLQKTISVPSSNPGNLIIKYRLEGWDSSDDFSISTRWDYFKISLIGNSTTVIVGPPFGNYITYPFTANKGTSAISFFSSGYGPYNYWDISSFGSHQSGMTFSAGSQPWVTRSYSLSGYAGQTITLQLSSSHTVEFKSWIHIDDVEWSVVSATLGSASISSSAQIPSSFNCVESSANASTGKLYTKLAGTAFSFEVVALKADNSVETNFVDGSNKNVIVELVDGSGSSACSSRTAINPAVSQVLTFSSSDAGRKASASMTVNSAYANLRCRITDSNQSPSVYGCSSDNFSVRPTGFTLSSTSNADATGLSTTATPIVKAGANFSLTAASGKVGYNLAPVIDSTKLSSHSGAVQNGIISGSFSSANAATGTATGSSFSYSEVGYFRFLANGVYDDSFTAVDSANSDCTNDFSNTLVGGKYGCKFGNTATTNYFGRFIPDHFSLSQGSTTAGCGSVFTYFGQDGFTTTFTLTAQNGSNVKTSNYNGSFAKLGLTNWNNFVFTASSLPSGAALSASATAPTGSWSNGAALVSAKHQVSRPSTLTGATSVSVSAAPVDVDGVTMASAPVAPAATLRYGRINLSNAHGSELLTMPVSMTAEYYSGASFITNSDDSCSVTTVSISDPLVSDSLVPADSCIWDDNSLSGSFKCSTIAPSGTTYRETASLVSGNFNLNLKAPQKTGPLDISASVANWLQFDWHGTGLENPSSKATFGIFKGNQKFIYLREVY